MNPRNKAADFMTNIKNFCQTIEFGRYSIAPAIEAARRCQEIEVETDGAEKLVAVAHASGAEVRFNRGYLISRTIQGTLWFGDSFGGWHPLD
ncbi:MAG: hypothetical protein C0507_15440 [Cyanobacteria bacterium PR.3.49]|nr:hypothetical protein [Cyanobacteria bacterium PR.3.49]